MIYKVSQQKLVLELSGQLKDMIEMPDWAQYVKTGPHRETLPKHPDWWFIRAASVLRTCHKKGPIGVSKLRNRYGGRRNSGFRPDRFQKSSGKILRTILQQLEENEFIKQEQVGVYKGRMTTSKGASLLAKAAQNIAKDSKGDN